MVFKGDLGAELEELFFGEFLAQARVEIVGDVRWRADHRVGEFDHQQFVMREKREIVTRDGEQFFI